MTRIHVHLDLLGLLSWPDRDLSRFKGVFVSDDGRTANTVAEIRAALTEALAGGQRCLPLGEPCEGFSPATGCPGHVKGDPNAKPPG